MQSKPPHVDFAVHVSLKIVARSSWECTPAMSTQAPFIGLLDVKPQQPGEPGMQRDCVPQALGNIKFQDARQVSDCGISGAFQSVLDQLSQLHRREILDRQLQIEKLQAELLKLGSGATDTLDKAWKSEGFWQTQGPSQGCSGLGEAFTHSTRMRKQHHGKREMQASQLLNALDVAEDGGEESFHADAMMQHDFGMESESHSVEATTWSEKWKNWLQSAAFEVLIAGALCLNVLWMAAELQIYGSMAGYNLGITERPLVKEQSKASIDLVFMLGDVLFTAFFALDVLVRMYVLKVEFWKTWSNYIDTAVSVASAVQVALFYTQTLPVNLALFRLLRIGKLARPIRMITMSSVLASLQLLIKCVTGSANMLFWSMCLLFFLQCVSGMIVSTLCRDYITNPANSIDRRQEVFQYFGTFTRTILTMFAACFLLLNTLLFHVFVSCRC